ncbi:MAG: recombination protein RecR [Rhodospirillaceae bacterium]|jgi:recombination protein RecR|nr:recombination protein RecR [Rhodospirillaceae bacterium]MBT3884393.1 recombination protein RecR [Rhodospirillaceae bacterium]MBT4116163.1 recombination protein RecR [Rhodospirillaceae bacterium]MBT4672336.1 recombination protein RecR [Rhodospirillaceae bacterium]MBT4720294.1 recombination protein RecR [Rhodospirillaceae bacterium]
MPITDIDRLIQMLAKLPGLGPRSARRAALSLINNPDAVMRPLALALTTAADNVKACSICGNLDTTETCAICTDTRRDGLLICVVEQVGDLWALERSATYSGHYHVLGGVLAPLDGIGPDDLAIDALVARAKNSDVTEIILATSATVDGRTTAHYISERLEGFVAKITVLAHGIPVGGELDYLDDGTLAAALRDRHTV